jgi:SAM-dependent methyltransferase
METNVYEDTYKFEEGDWWHKARRELLLQIVSQIYLTNNSNPLRILDLGCGAGLNLKKMEKYGHSIGLDYYKYALLLCKSRGISNLVRASGDMLPFKKGIFDVVCALDVLEHIKDDDAAIKELHRVMASAGSFILTAPAFQALWSSHDVAAHHMRRYSRMQLLEKLEKCGFEVSKCTYWNFHLFPLVWLVRRFRRNHGTRAKSDIRKLSWCFNSVLLFLLRIENKAISMNISFPFGVSIICICRKTGGDINDKGGEK